MSAEAHSSRDPRHGADDLTVDVHAHVHLPEVEQLVADRPEVLEQRAVSRRRMGPRSADETDRMLTERRPLLVDLDLRLAWMDAAGVDAAVLSTPTQFHYWADSDLAREIYAVTNEGVARYCEQAPGRLTGLGGLPLQHPELCVEALEHAWTLGLKGVIVSSFAERADGSSGVELSDPRLEPLWARASELGATIFLHPLGCTLDSRLDDWYLSNSVGQPVEHAIALTRLIFSGVFDRHPRLRLLAAHGGGYLPGFLGRTDHAWRVRRDARTCEYEPSSYLRRIFVDSCVHAPASLRTLVETCGADRVLMGSDYPFDMGVDDPVARLMEAGLGAGAEHAIACANARCLGLAPG